MNNLWDLAIEKANDTSGKAFLDVHKSTNHTLDIQHWHFTSI